MKILIFNWKDIKHPYAGGAEVHMHELAKVWIDNGNEVSWFCPKFKNAKKYEVIDKIKFYRSGGRYSVYLIAPFYYLLKFAGKYDTIIDVENGIPFFTPFFSRKKKFLVILHVHKDVFFKELPLFSAYFAYFLEMKFMPLVYRKIQFITISENSANDIKKYCLTNKKIEIVYPALLLENYSKGKKTIYPSVSYVGRLKGYKSVNDLINAFSIVIKKIPNAKLFIAGRGESENELKNIVVKLKLSNNVNFLGFISEEDKVKIMQKSWVTVNPSFIEGWGITCIESNACGTPVIASDVGGLRDSVKNGKTGFLFEYGNIEQLASKISFILKNKKLREMMNLESIKWASNFSWKKSANKFFDIINRK